MTKLRESLQWLKRMPMKWRILFGTQIMVFSLALNYRLKVLSDARDAVKSEGRVQETQVT